MTTRARQWLNRIMGNGMVGISLLVWWAHGYKASQAAATPSPSYSVKPVAELQPASPLTLGAFSMAILLLHSKDNDKGWAMS